MARFDDLAGFAAIVRAGSFTRAAAQLGVTQSAISQTIRALERRLDLKLLNRTTRSVAPTEAGERLYQTVGPRFEDIVAERFDIGVRLGGDVAKDMIAMRIAPDMRMAVVGSPGYFSGHPRPL